jgi:hypothetical protein
MSYMGIIQSYVAMLPYILTIFPQGDIREEDNNVSIFYFINIYIIM